MLPWLAFGHLLPFLQLAKLMASKGHTISFISTPTNINRLPQTFTPFIRFVNINLPKVENLPDDAESTRDVTADKVKYLKIAYDGLRKPMADFIRTANPDWIICDFASYWLGSIAAEYGVLTAFFSVCPALICCFYGSPATAMDTDERVLLEEFLKPPKWIPFQSQVRPSSFQVTRALQHLINNDENVSDTYRVGATIAGCDVVLVRSCSDFEPDWLNLLHQLYHKPIIPTGLLPANDDDSVDNNDHEESAYWLETRQWLDKYEKGSVVYVSFGTETKPSRYELTQLALGLELSGLPFFLVLISQRGSSDDEVIELPSGFEDRTRGRGVVCRGWAPQFKIVSHESVGGLLIHSGMSSVVEGLQLGKPLVLLPFTWDQGVIGSYLVEKKMACVIEREDADGSFTPESVARLLRCVMWSEDGGMCRERAKEMMSLFGDRSVQDRLLDDLMRFLRESMK